MILSCRLIQVLSKLFEGASREQVWKWLCSEAGIELTPRTFFTLLYRARKRAKQAAMTAPQRAAAMRLMAEVEEQKPSLTRSKVQSGRPVTPIEESPCQLPENPTGQQRLRAALNVKTPVLDWDIDDRFAKYRTEK
nr:hypothetical protein [Acetobacter pasteurianus]